MAEYDGFRPTTYESESRKALCHKGFPNYVLYEMTTDERYGGQYSLRLWPGSFYDVEYGCDEGDSTISVYMKFDSGASPRLEVRDFYSHELLQYATPVGAGAEWEKVSLVLASEKKIYIVRLVNYGTGFAYFDDLD